MLQSKSIVIFTDDKDKEFVVLEQIKQILLDNKVYYQVHEIDSQKTE